MAFQTGKNIVISTKVEATYNTAPGAAGALQVRLNPSAGLSLKKALIQSNEVRSDGQTSMGRHGSRMVDGSYSGELSVGGYDAILEAVMRSTWVAAVVITQATMTSITTPTTSTIVAAGGSWITQGVRVGDVVRLTGFATAANNSINLRVKAVTTSTITVLGTPLVVDAAPDASFTLTILKKLKNGTTPTRRTFYVDQYYQDIDISQVFGGVRWISLKITGSPDGMATVEFGVLGASMNVLATGASPYFTTPTLPTGIALVFADATISLGGADLAVATAFELTVQITAKTEPVVAAGGISPDVFDNDMRVTGTVSLLRQDLANVSNFINETELELHVLLVEPEIEPKDCIAIYVPRIKLSDAAAPLGGDGGVTETLPFTTGKKEGVSGYDDSTLTISTSAA